MLTNRNDIFTPKHIYLIDPRSLMLDRGPKYDMDILTTIWFTQKKNVRTIHFGHFSESRDHGGDRLTVEEFLPTINFPAYPQYSWDGKTMKSFLKQELQDKYKERLDPILQNFPKIPAGFEGWYRLDSTDPKALKQQYT